jgi:hypothetical protein
MRRHLRPPTAGPTAQQRSAHRPGAGAAPRQPGNASSHLEDIQECIRGLLLLSRAQRAVASGQALQLGRQRRSGLAHGTSLCRRIDGSEETRSAFWLGVAGGAPLTVAATVTPRVPPGTLAARAARAARSTCFPKPKGVFALQYRYRCVPCVACRVCCGQSGTERVNGARVARRRQLLRGSSTPWRPAKQQAPPPEGVPRHAHRSKGSACGSAGLHATACGSMRQAQTVLGGTCDVRA